MAAPKKYFQDRIILLLLSINIFLALGAAIFVLARLNGGHGSSYIVQYRSSLGINAFKPGSISNLLSFIVFGLLVLVVNTFLSLRLYHLSRQLAVLCLSLCTLLLVLNIIISNALLVLH